MQACDICNVEMRERISSYESPYHYTECGLDNVYLLEVRVYSCLQCGVEVADIPRPQGLHYVLAREILMKPTSMTGEEFRFLRKETQMKPKEFAEFLGVDLKTITNWERLTHLSRQNDITVRFAVANKLTELSGKQGFFDLNTSHLQASELGRESEMDAETEELAANSYLGYISSVWQVGPLVC